MHLNSKLLFAKYAKKIFRNNIRVLEIGPGTIPSEYQKIVNNPTLHWETIDLKLNDSHLTYVATSEYKFPIPDNTYDIVVSGQVIEHVKKIWTWMKEISRVCKVAGFVITINPVSWPYHEAPVDCWRIYPEGMKALYEEAGLIVEFSKVECLEKIQSRPGYPYTSFVPPSGTISKIIQLTKNLIRWPVPYSLDTITIGRKI